LREALAHHADAGKPLWAECGGMMALFDELVTSDGTKHTMWGLLPGTVTMQARLAALGPLQLALPGGSLRGHTFHYSRCESSMRPAGRACRPGDTADCHSGEPFFRRGAIAASYFHAWFASSPPAVASLFLPREPE
jgi:cobyrinic acid a,c-diamide synthase